MSACFVVEADEFASTNALIPLASHACIRDTAYPQELRALFYNVANLDSR